MQRLIVLTSILAVLRHEVAGDSSANVLKRSVVSGNYDYNPYHDRAKQAQLYHLLQAQGHSFFEEPTIQADVTKHSPLVLQYQAASAQTTLPVSNSHINQQYQTVTPQAARPAAVSEDTALTNNDQAQHLVSPHQLRFQHIPPLNEHQIYYEHQPKNQYTVKQASLQQTVGQSGPSSTAFTNQYNPMQLLVNGVLGKQQSHIIPQTTSTNTKPLIHTKQAAPTPLVYSQIYHPLHTSVKISQQKQRPAIKIFPLTPPRMYTNFHPMITKEVTSTDATIAQHMHHKDETESDKSSETEEEEEEGDKSDEENYKREEDNKTEEDDTEYMHYSKPAKYRFIGKFKHENNPYKLCNHKGDNDDEEQHDGYRGNIYEYSGENPEHSKLSSRYKYPKDHDGSSHLKEHAKSLDEHKATSYTGSDLQKPSMEYKMYKYAKSTNNPHRNENAGKESEMVPALHASSNLYETKWMITKSSSNMN